MRWTEGSRGHVAAVVGWCGGARGSRKIKAKREAKKYNAVCLRTDVP